MSDTLGKSAQRVQAALDGFGLALQVRQMPASTRTAPEAAEVVGCDLGQIVKSLVFRNGDDDSPVLILVSGENRVDVKGLGRRLGIRLKRADADYVRQHSGFAIGGVPPLGHATPMKSFIDEDLLAHETVWAAAGTPRALFALPSRHLTTVTGGRVVRVTAADEDGL